MNERIKELYTQVVGSDKLNFDSYLAEKFAELIIQQCVDICLINQIKNENISAGECAYDIQEHFGVD